MNKMNMEKPKELQRIKNYVHKLRDSLNSAMARDQSSKDPLNKSSTWVPVCFTSSKIYQSHSLHNIHIKYKGTIFQIFEDCLQT